MKLRQAVQAGAVALRNAIVGGNLASLALARDPRRLVRYVSESLFLYRAMNAWRTIPQKNVFEVLPQRGAESITLGNLRSPEHWFGPIASYATDIVSLCLICRLLRPKTVFEIGTLRGYTTLHLALNTPPDSRILTLDLPPAAPVNPVLYTTAMDDVHIEQHAEGARYAFDGTEVASKITCLFGDSAAFDYTPYHNGVDFFFIDGAHSYEYVRSDTLNAFKCCTPGSVIAWHDFGRVGVNGVSRWLRELSLRHEIFAVPGGSLAFTVLKRQVPAAS